MKLAISNIAWAMDDMERVAAVMAKKGITGVEIAPTTKWENPTQVPDAELAAFRDSWQSHGIQIVALQALLFGHPELTLFEGAAEREATLEYLAKIAHLGAVLGAGPMVFGSPKNRRVEGLSAEEAHGIAVDFFHRAGEVAKREGTLLCLEPNPKDYQCNFVTEAAQGYELVEAVDSEGFCLHLDAAGMTLAGDEPACITRYAARLRHFHVSEPYLGRVGLPNEHATVPHREFASALRAANYGGWCSVEMRNPGVDDIAEEIERVLSFLVEVYGA